jgi:hypothetical protein
LADILWVQETGGSVAQLGGDGSGGATSGSSSGSSSGARVLWAGKGDGSFTVITNFAGQNGRWSAMQRSSATSTATARHDILWDSRSGTDTRSTGTRMLWLSDGAAPDLVTAITTGIGANVAVTYKPLTSSAVYTKDNTAVDPQLDLQGPMFVVSRVDSATASAAP